MAHETSRIDSLEYSKEHWQKPREQPIPRPTYAPAVVAIAIVCLFWVGDYAADLVARRHFIFVGLADWIGELRHNTNKDERTVPVSSRSTLTAKKC